MPCHTVFKRWGLHLYYQIAMKKKKFDCVNCRLPRLINSKCFFWLIIKEPYRNVRFFFLPSGYPITDFILKVITIFLCKGMCIIFYLY